MGESGAREKTIAATRTGERAGGEARLHRGSSIGRYVILGELGAGGMGVVYAAYDPDLDRKIVVKLLHADRVDATGHDRLLREAQAIAKLSHPNVVAVHDVGDSDGRVFVAMEFVEGPTLGQWIADTPRTRREILAVFVDAARGLAAAHAAGLVHRDFKPDNVLVGADGRVRVMDFGLARPAGKTLLPTLDDSQVRPQRGALAAELTQNGTVLGTPAYMAPEQHLAQPADERTDQFSFCVALYEATYGERPFGGDTLAALAFNVTQGNISPPTRPGTVPARLRNAMLRGLRVDPSERWPSLQDLIVVLQHDPSIRWRRWIPWTAIGLLVVGTSVGAHQYVELRTGLCRGAAEAVSRDWSAPQREAIRTSLAAQAIPQKGRELIEQELDHYASQWVEHHVQACEAHRRGEQSAHLFDKRMACLSERWAQFQVVIDVLGRADGTIARQAAELIGNLPRLNQCSDENRLNAMVPLPDDTRVARLVDDLHEQLGRARGFEDAGRYRESRDVAQDVLARAAGLNYPPIEASARLRLGSLAEREANVDRAQSELRRAYLVGLAAGADDTAAEAALGLAFLVSERLSAYDDGLSWTEHAQAVIERSGGDAIALASLLNVRGLVRNAAADFEAARGDFEASLELFKTNLGDEHFRTAALYNNLAMVDFQLGRYDAAEHGYRRAIQIDERRLGADHPILAQMLANLAATVKETGRKDEALALFERAIAISRTRLPDEHDLMARLRYAYAELLRGMGKHAHARAQYEDAIRIWRTLERASHPLLGLAYRGLGEVLTEVGRYGEAAARLDDSLRILGRLELRHPLSAAPLISLGNLRIEQRRAADAIPLLRRALAVREWHRVPPQDLAEAQLALAKAVWEHDGDHAAAIALAERARRHYATAGRPWRAQMRNAEEWLAGRKSR